MYIYIAKLKIVSKFGDAIYLLLDDADMYFEPLATLSVKMVDFYEK
jgi:hypothetical protein